MSPVNKGETSWIETPIQAEWPVGDDDERNPFVKWRRMLHSWHRAIETGWADNEFVSLVREIDEAIMDLSGTGFRVTPTGIWEEPSPKLPTSVLWKDETINVGGSHKARHLMGILLHLAVDAVSSERRLAIASCGNAALGATTVARAVGRPIDVFIPTWANPAIVNELDALGASIHVCERSDSQSGDPCMVQFQEAILEGALPFGVQATENPLTLDGGRTIGWELSSAIKEHHISDLVIQVGGGALLTSCTIGLMEAKEFMYLEQLPRIWAVQAEGCAPFHKAWEALPHGSSPMEIISFAIENAERLMRPWEDPRSLATGILDDVTYDWLGVTRALLETGGGSVVATERNIVLASELVPSLGISTEPTGAASIAGVVELLEQGKIQVDTKVAALLTGRSR